MQLNVPNLTQELVTLFKVIWEGKVHKLASQEKRTVEPLLSHEPRNPR